MQKNLETATEGKEQSLFHNPSLQLIPRHMSHILHFILWFFENWNFKAPSQPIHSIECADRAVASKSNAIQWPHGLDAKRNASWNRFLCTWVVCSLHGAEEPLSRPFASSFWNQGTAASTALDSGWSRNQATPGPFANEGCWVPSSNTGKRAGMPAKRRGMVNNHATNPTLKTTQSFIP